MQMMIKKFWSKNTAMYLALQFSILPWITDSVLTHYKECSKVWSILHISSQHARKIKKLCIGLKDSVRAVPQASKGQCLC